MSRWINGTTAVGTITLGIVCSLGCSMGAHPHDCKYAAYGGLIDRVDRVHGRVGSVFDPAEVVTYETVEATAEPTPAEPLPEPEPADPAEAPESADSPEPAEARLDSDREFIHAEHDVSTLELIEPGNRQAESLDR